MLLLMILLLIVSDSAFWILDTRSWMLGSVFLH
jgi:hypothetical protein